MERKKKQRERERKRDLYDSRALEGENFSTG